LIRELTNTSICSFEVPLKDPNPEIRAFLSVVLVLMR